MAKNCDQDTNKCDGDIKELEAHAIIGFDGM